MHEIPFLKRRRTQDCEEQEILRNEHLCGASGIVTAEKMDNEESFISQESDVKELVNPSERLQFPTMQFVQNLDSTLIKVGQRFLKS